MDVDVRSADLADDVVWQMTVVTDREAAIDVKGAVVICQCLSVPYTRWPQLFPPLQINVLAAPEQSDALLVSLENVSGYGSTGGTSMSKDLPRGASSFRSAADQAGRAWLVSGARVCPQIAS